MRRTGLWEGAREFSLKGFAARARSRVVVERMLRSARERTYVAECWVPDDVEDRVMQR